MDITEKDECFSYMNMNLDILFVCVHDSNFFDVCGSLHVLCVYIHSLLCNVHVHVQRYKSLCMVHIICRHVCVHCVCV